MPRYKLTIAYDGADFHGWQMQHPPDPASDPALGDARPRLALRTVQEEVRRAVQEIVREPVVVQGASRTDAGVHARGQVAAFTCSGDGPSEVGNGVEGADAGGAASEPGSRASGGWPVSRGVDRLVRAVNGRLPEDVLVLGAEAVGLDFEPIGGATSKGYTYTIHASRDRTLFDRRYVHHVWEPLDVAAMSDAAARLVGEHDFAAFAAVGHGRLTTVRRVHSCRVLEMPREGGAPACGAPVRGAPPEPALGPTGRLATSHGFTPQRVVIEISGSGFLWNMVRIIAGTLVEVGRGRRAAADIPRILQSLDRRQAGVTLPASGLCLEWIRYTGGAGPDSE